MIGIQRGKVELTVLPEIGGSVANLLVDGHPILRPSPPKTATVLETGMYPLVPFCNRIRNGFFDIDGTEVQLHRNFNDSPHPLHGQGWQSPWQVAEHTAQRIRLTYRHMADSWPWEYAATLTYELGNNGFRATIQVQNLSSSTMPAGLGFHPFFILNDRTKLMAFVKGYWKCDPEALPSVWSSKSVKDWKVGAKVGHNDYTIDNCHTDFKGQARITGGNAPDISIMASPNCRWLHLYVPVGQDFFCVEPVTHMPDPFSHEDSGIVYLKPGATLSAQISIQASVKTRLRSRGFNWSNEFS